MTIKDLSSTIHFDDGLDDEAPDVGKCRVDYVKKLIGEIKSDIKKEMVEVDGELCYPQKWINVALLCDVLSAEL